MYFQVIRNLPNFGHQVAEVATGAVDTCIGEDDDHGTSGVASRLIDFGPVHLNVKHYPQDSNGI